MMCLFKPNTYDPKDWQCPKPSCRTVNFKKRLTCVSCGARKPDGSSRPLDDWRDGEKLATGPWNCTDCLTKNEPTAFYCMQCKKPSEEMHRMLEAEKAQRAADEGRGGGLYDRQDPNDKKQWDSDGEDFDEFGRRKTKKSKGGPGGASNGASSGDARGGAPWAGIFRRGSSEEPNPRESTGSRRGSSRSPQASRPPAPAAVPAAPLADKHKAALERLRNKHAGGAGGRGGRSKSRSRSRRRR